MSNIECLRQLHHKNLNLKRAQFRVKEFYSYEKDLVCSVLRKGLDLYVQEKSLGFSLFHHGGVFLHDDTLH